ncbi:hypothetical protein D3C78_1624910 [compost metagenome]
MVVRIIQVNSVPFLSYLSVARTLCFYPGDRVTLNNSFIGITQHNPKALSLDAKIHQNYIISMY